MLLQTHCSRCEKVFSIFLDRSPYGYGESSICPACKEKERQLDEIAERVEHMATRIIDQIVDKTVNKCFPNLLKEKYFGYSDNVE